MMLLALTWPEAILACIVSIVVGVLIWGDKL